MRRLSTDDEVKLKELEAKLNRLVRSGDLLRAVKWWREGYLDADRVDRFLRYYIAFEMLASIKGYKKEEKCKDKEKDEKKDKKCDGWAERFAEDYGITYRPDRKTGISWIRNKLVHEPGPEKDEAERLAREFADRFGIEVLEAMRKIIGCT